MTETPQALTVQQAAELLQVAPATLYRLMAQGKIALRPVRIGRVLRIPASEVEHFLNTREATR